MNHIPRTRICNATIALVCFGIVAPITWVIADRDVPFVRESGEITPAIAMPGQIVQVTWRGKRNRNCPGTVERKLVDAKGTVFTLETVEAAIANVPGTPLPRTFSLPSAMAPGWAKYHATARFICNFTQYAWPIKTEFPPIFFQVSSPPELRRLGGPARSYILRQAVESPLADR